MSQRRSAPAAAAAAAGGLLEVPDADPRLLVTGQAEGDEAVPEALPPAKPSFAPTGPSPRALLSRPLAPIAVDWSAAAAVLGKLQAFLPELARANEALEETDPERSGFELERVDEPEEVLTRDADLALTASDIAEAADPAEGSDGEQEAEAADEADGEPPAIHMVRARPPLPAHSLFRSPLRVCAGSVLRSAGGEGGAGGEPGRWAEAAERGRDQQRPRQRQRQRRGGGGRGESLEAAQEGAGARAARTKHRRSLTERGVPRGSLSKHRLRIGDDCILEPQASVVEAHCAKTPAVVL